MLALNSALKFAKVSSHQFSGPRRFMHFAARRETLEVRFYVQHRSAIDGVEFSDAELQTIDGFKFTDSDTDTVGPILRTLREDSHPRPIRAAARMPRAFFDFIFRKFIQEKYNVHMRILIEA